MTSSCTGENYAGGEKVLERHLLLLRTTCSRKKGWNEKENRPGANVKGRRDVRATALNSVGLPRPL